MVGLCKCCPTTSSNLRVWVHLPEYTVRTTSLELRVTTCLENLEMSGKLNHKVQMPFSADAHSGRHHDMRGKLPIQPAVDEVQRQLYVKMSKWPTHGHSGYR